MKFLKFSCFTTLLFLIKFCYGQKPESLSKMIIPSTFIQKNYQGYSINIPSGWEIFNYGQCSELGLVSRDPNNPKRSFFYYGIGGYCYLTYQQKQIDDNYVAMGGIKSPLIGFPVISPFTPENFLSNYYLVREVALTKQPGIILPELYNVQIISISPVTQNLNNSSARSSLIRAVYSNKIKSIISEGLFLLTTQPIQIGTYGPGSSLGIVFSFIGITAPLGELDAMITTASNCIASFNIDPSYVNNCMRISNATTQSTLQAGKTLSTISDGIMKSWENRSKTYDIISQKRSDAILGRERLYDPSNGNVYEVDNSFIDKYLTNPQKYNLSNLQKLPPDNYNLWNKPTLNGNNIKVISNN